TVDEMARDLDTRFAWIVGVAEHPFRGRRAMVDIPCVDVRAGVEEQIGHRPRSSKMQRRLPITATLVNARWILLENGREEVEPVEVRRGTRINIRARREQSLGDIARRGVQRMKAPGPPRASPVWVGAELQKDVDKLGVTLARDLDERRRVEPE